MKGLNFEREALTTAENVRYDCWLIGFVNWIWIPRLIPTMAVLSRLNEHVEIDGTEDIAAFKWVIFRPRFAENLIEFDSLSITYGQRIGLALMAWNRVETNGMMKIVKNALMNNQVLSKKYVLLSTGNLSNKWHRDIIVRFFNRNICLLKNRANCPALLDIYVQFSGVGLGTKNCNLKIFWTILLF